MNLNANNLFIELSFQSRVSEKSPHLVLSLSLMSSYISSLINISGYIYFSLNLERMSCIALNRPVIKEIQAYGTKKELF